MDNIFIAASREKLRFETNKGFLTTEDLWDLSLVSLDNIAKAVNRKLKDSQEESFIEKKTTATTELDTKLEILKFIIATKQDEAAVKSNAKKKAQEIELLEQLLEEKELEGVKSLSPEEIKQKIAALKAS